MIPLFLKIRFRKKRRKGKDVYWRCPRLPNTGFISASIDESFCFTKKHIKDYGTKGICALGILRPRHLPKYDAKNEI